MGKYLGPLGDIISVLMHAEAARQAFLENDNEAAASHIGAAIGDIGGGLLAGLAAAAILVALGTPPGAALTLAALAAGAFGSYYGEKFLGEAGAAFYRALTGADDADDPYGDLFGDGGPLEGQEGQFPSPEVLSSLLGYFQAFFPTLAAAVDLINLFEAVAGLIDPLVIDLDGDGVTTTAVENSTAYFDLDNNGVAERAGWIEPEDGFVVHDWSGDGIINNRSEQFATFDELSRHDTNGDGVISAEDTAETKLMDLDGDGLLENVTLGYDSLKVWVDANSDGKTDEGELKTLAELGITSIDLDKTTIDVVDNGNELNAKSIVSFGDGTTADIYGISFNRDTTDADFSARIAALDLSPENLAPRIDAFLLPQLAGAGNVPSLLIAALESDDVLNVLRGAADFKVSETEEYMLRVQQLLVDWAGVGDVDPGPSDHGNQRHIAAMEEFAGQEFPFSTGGVRGKALDAGWDAFVSGIGLRIALQVDTDFNPGGLISYDPQTDGFAGDFVGFVEHISDVMFEDALTSSFDNQGLLRMVDVLWQSVGDGLTSAQQGVFDAFFTEAFTLHPQAVPTSFYANSKYYDPEHNLSLDPDYVPLKAVAGVSLVPGGDRVIHLADVDTDFHDYEGGDDEGKTYDLTLNEAGALMGTVTEFNDNASDNGLNYYGAGDDYYAGDDGSDLYYFGSSVGYDTIFEDDLYHKNIDDVDLLLVASTKENTILTRQGEDLFISWGGSGSIVRVQEQFQNDHAFEGIVFGASAGMDAPEVIEFDAAWIEANSWYRGGDGRDALIGSNDDENFHGARGDDYIDVKHGIDKIAYKSGDGNDVLVGGGSSTTLQLEDLDPGDLFLFIRLETLYIEDRKTGHVITVEDQLTGRGLTEISFENGESWSRAEIEARAIVVGTEFADELQGSDRADTYWGQEGSDVLRGGKNSDTFLWATGDGNDFISEYALDYGTDVLKLTDVTFQDVYLTRGNANDNTESTLFITIKATGEVITLSSQFYSQSGVELIEFADGQTIDQAEMLANLTLVGTDQSEILYGSYASERIIGGLGDDFLRGSSEGDIYEYMSGDGNDTIYETTTGSDADVLELTDLTLADVYLSTGNYADGTQDDLHVTVKATGETITVDQQFHPIDAAGIEQIVFSDGTTFGETEIVANLQLVGTDQDNTLRGGYFSEQIVGGLGDDTLSGDSGGDTYVYASGDGNDTIFEASNGAGEDVLKFTDLNVADVEFTLGERAGSQGYDLFVTVKATGEDITVSDNAIDGAANGLERIEFADGTSLDANGITHLATYGAAVPEAYLDGNEMANNLVGTEANETLTGNGGDDILQGRDGSDTYVFARGDGSDTIEDGGNGDTDALRIKDYAASEVSLSRIGTSYDLVLTFSGTSDQITLINTLNGSSADQIEKIVFDDNTVWTMTDVREMVLAQAGTAGDDVILGFNGADTLAGNAGNDDLAGASGNDTYLYARGDGFDKITENTFHGTSDMLRFTDINPADVSVYRDGDTITLVIAESSPGAGDNGAVELVDSAADFFERGIESIVFADGTVWSRNDWVSVAVENAAPTVEGNTVTALVPGAPITIAHSELLGNDSDPDSDALSIIGFRNVVGGQVSLGAGGTFIVTLDDDNVPVTFDYLVTDGVYTRTASVTAGYVQPDVIDELDPATINGTSGDDLYRLAGGTHTINLGTGADTLIVSADTGDYTLYDTGSGAADENDRIIFAEGIALSDVRALRNGDHVVLSFEGLSGSVTIRDFSNDSSSWHQRQIDWFEFSDGTVLSHEDFFAETYFKGTVGNDVIRGTYGVDTFTLGLGSDTLYLNRGSDRIVMSDAISDIRLHDWGRSSSDVDDTLVFADGITIDEIIGTRDGDHIRLSFTDRAGSITIEQASRDVSWYLERQIDWFEFSDGTRLSYQDFYAQTYFKGTDGNDVIRGTYGADTFTLGLGSDTIYLHRGSDRIVMSDAIGDIRLHDWGRSSSDVNDTLVFADGITIDEIIGTRDGDHIRLSFTDRAGSITIEQASRDVSWYLERQIDWFEFSDGTRLNFQDFYAQTYFKGTDGDDVIRGTYGADTFTLGLGSDTIYTHRGSDRIIMSDAIGDIRIQEWGRSSSDLNDTLVFASGITIDQINVTYSEDDLVLTFDGRSGSIAILEALREVSWYQEYQIEWFEFSDGTRLSHTDFLNQTYFSGTDQNDDIFGTYGNDVLNGGDGDDILNGGRGDDDHYGGAGNDLIIANQGADTFDGGADVDTLDFTFATGDEVFDLTAGTVAFESGGSETILNFENLIAGSGDNRIIGSSVDNQFTGGGGSDTFVFSVNAGGHDTIMDFSAGAGSADLLEFGTSQFADLASVIAAATDDGTDTTITIDAATSIILKSVLVSDLHQDDFQFV
ncbi:calcium-binding protein [uncultured Roseibium sp.]|uniref:calcium-binding protein n=1 Tax=uncultured Roseibium sp. TaxID=1936171 RepID=UPI0026185DB7|nr:calcium-binding protein [uncultured Roseibium sp.]